jgi:hypothetical protein
MALDVIEQVKEMIKELKSAFACFTRVIISASGLVAHLENSENTDMEFRRKAGELLVLYEKQFGVKGLIDGYDGIVTGKRKFHPYGGIPV